MSGRRVPCPTCRREVDWDSSAYRPFCSERCRLIDLGAWLAEAHAIAGEPAELPPQDGEGHGTRPRSG